MADNFEIRIKALVEGLANVQNLATELQSVGKEGAKASAPGIDAIGKDAVTASQHANALGSAIGSIKNQLLGLIAVGGLVGLGKSVVDTAIQFDSVNASLKVITGSTEAASAEFSFLQSESDRLGLGIKEVAQGFIGLSAAAKGTSLEGQGVRDTFSTVAEAMARLGKSSVDTKGVLLGVQQAISKSTLSAEEFRGQIAERLPGALAVGARALAVTEVKFNSLLENGLIKTVDFLPKFNAELQRSFNLGGTVDTLQAQIGRFQNALVNAQNNFAKSGFLDGVLAGVKALDDALKDPATQANLNKLGATIGAVLKTSIEFGREILTVVQTFAAFKALDVAISAVKSLGAAYDGVGGKITAVKALAAAPFVVSIAIVGFELLGRAIDAYKRYAESTRDLTAAERARRDELLQQNTDLELALQTLQKVDALRKQGAEGVAKASAEEIKIADDLIAAYGSIEVAELALLQNKQALLAVKIQEAKANGASTIELGDLAIQNKLLSDRIQETVGKIHDQRDALEEQAVASATVATTISTGLTPAALELVKAFDAAIEKGSKVSDAINKVTENFNNLNFKSIQDVVGALSQLETSGKAAGKVVREELISNIEKLSGRELLNFQINAEAAFGGSEKTAKQLALTLEASTSVALKKLGVDAELATGQLSKGFLDALAQVEALAENSKNSSAVISAAFAKLIDQATTVQAIEALNASLAKLKSEGKITGDDVTDNMARIGAKATEVAQIIPNTLGDALTRLGIKTKAQLQATADQFKIDYEKAAASGKAGLDQLIIAHQKWADAAKAANGGVAVSSIATAQATLEARKAATEAATAEGFAVRQAARDKDDEKLANERLAESEKALAEAKKKQAEADSVAKEAAKSKEQGMKDFGAVIAAIVNNVESLSSKTAAAFDSAFGLPVKNAQGSVEALQASLKKVNDEMAFNIQRADAFSSVNFAGLVKFNDASNRLQRSFFEQAIQAKQLEERLGALGDVTFRNSAAFQQIASNAEGASVSFSLLDAQQLTGLQGAIQSARDKVAQFNQDIANTVGKIRGIGDSLQDELDRARGNLVAIQNREFERKKAELLALATEAGTAGANDVQRSLSLLQQVQDAKLKKLAEEEAAKRASADRLHADALSKIEAQKAIERAKASDIVAARPTITTAPTTLPGVAGAQVTNNNNFSFVLPGGTVEQFVRQNVAPVLDSITRRSV